MIHLLSLAYLLGERLLTGTITPARHSAIYLFISSMVTLALSLSRLFTFKPESLCRISSFENINTPSEYLPCQRIHVIMNFHEFTTGSTLNEKTFLNYNPTQITKLYPLGRDATYSRLHIWGIKLYIHVYFVLQWFHVLGMCFMITCLKYEIYQKWHHI